MCIFKIISQVPNALDIQVFIEDNVKKISSFKMDNYSFILTLYVYELKKLGHMISSNVLYTLYLTVIFTTWKLHIKERIFNYKTVTDMLQMSCMI